MSNKRGAESQGGRKRPRANYNVTSRTNISGPGVWATCARGRERSTIGELYDLFESIAEELWPTEQKEASSREDDQDAEEEDEDNLEEMVKKELAGLKKPRVQKRFANCQTGTPCVIFISCKPPIDPVKLVLHQFFEIERTGVTRVKQVLRLTPASDSCVASMPEILLLAKKVIPPAFEVLPEKEDGSKKYRYKIDLSMRNHDKIQKSELLPQIAQCVPAEAGHTVDLDDPEIVIFVQILKSVCGISVMPHYQRFKRFNVEQVGEAARRRLETEEQGKE
ncbi:hypothetical protein M422DRAFT_26869 [Sphaerobolus stellatus SS14]|nr:hypothetical protein M422DRAFT_26869 [Sphaerobolus stellatus SS14]